MAFRVTGLSAAPFRHLYGLSEQELAVQGAIRVIADAASGFPDRIEMRHAAPGETVLLLNHVCQPAATPYRATHAIYVREGAERAYDRIDEIPEVMRARLLSLRGYDADGVMHHAAVAEGRDIETAIHDAFADARIAYLHAHNARPGCYACRIDRA